MNLTFTYDKKEDVWCLLNKGKSSNNSPNSTNQYKKLIEYAGDKPDEDSAFNFVDKYIVENEIDIKEHIINYQKEFNEIYDEFQNIAERVFGVSLKEDITAYLTINTRCPYSIKENLFFVSVSNNNFIKTIMHELWHFYTWHRFGADEQERLGAEKYNEIKEALTVLLNIECKHLLPEGIEDGGYPQHQELRQKILKLWQEKQSIDFVWKNIS